MNLRKYFWILAGGMVILPMLNGIYSWSQSSQAQLELRVDPSYFSPDLHRHSADLDFFLVLYNFTLRHGKKPIRIVQETAVGIIAKMVRNPHARTTNLQANLAMVSTHEVFLWFVRKIPFPDKPRLEISPIQENDYSRTTALLFLWP